jgi:purine-binding chemotaxis protein CheW
VGGTWALTFRLAGREHAVPVGEVVEVVRMVAVTPLPAGVPWVVGVLNYRGQVMPVVDGRVRLGMPRRDRDLSTPMIVVAAGGQAAALVVDEALEVLRLPPEALQAPDVVGAAAAMVSAVARHGTRLIVLLDAAALCAGATERDYAGLSGRAHDAAG